MSNFDWLNHIMNLLACYGLIRLLVDSYNFVLKLLKPVRNKNCCPLCDSPMSMIRSTNKKMCTSCDFETSWHLDEGQLPLVRSNRMVKRNDSK